jgi:DnaJ-class molecular chaperone
MDPLIVVALRIAVGYVIACIVWPFANCSRCSGSGKRRSLSGRALWPCRRCSGSGKQVRIGRWIYESLSRQD